MSEKKQAEVKIYTTPWCPYCIRAKSLLERKGIAYEDTNVSTDPEMRQKLRAWTGKTSVPQIFINGKGIGGCDELFALDAVGELDSLVAT